MFRIGPCHGGSFLVVILANQREHGQPNMVAVPLPGQALRSEDAGLGSTGFTAMHGVK